MSHAFPRSCCRAAAGIALCCAALSATAEGTVDVIGHRTAEGDYVARMRAMLTRQMRFPTGREASLTHPEGTVSVWFVLSRDGEVLDRGIAETSNSTLLDAQARTLVGRPHYEGLPAAAWAGESEHRFLATYRFVRTPQSEDPLYAVTLR